MSATVWGGEVKYTRRFLLGRLLSNITKNFLLLTATPHNGKEEDFQLFLSLVDADRAKDLTYRLYTIAERKNWANEAYAYNALVVAWPDIQARAAALKDVVPNMFNLFLEHASTTDLLDFIDYVF